MLVCLHPSGLLETLHTMQLRVDVSADGKVLATLADNELQVMCLSDSEVVTLKQPHPKMYL